MLSRFRYLFEFLLGVRRGEEERLFSMRSSLVSPLSPGSDVDCCVSVVRSVMPPPVCGSFSGYDSQVLSWSGMGDMNEVYDRGVAGATVL